MPLALIIDDQARALMSVALRDAERNVVPYTTVRARSETATARAQIVQIPTCYEATYTVEEHAPGVPCRHLTVSIIDGESGPHPLIVDEIMREFGFKGSRADVVGWLQPIDATRFAVNLLEPLDGNWEKLTSPSVALHNTGVPEVHSSHQ